MSIQFENTTVLRTNDGQILAELYGEILQVLTEDLIAEYNILDLNILRQILSQRIIQPVARISVLHDDETVDYIIPNSDIINNGISYNEGYQNGERRSISLKLINKAVRKESDAASFFKNNGVTLNKDLLQVTGGQLLASQEQIDEAVLCVDKSDFDIESTDYVISYPYMPSTTTLWYGTKIGYDIGFKYQGTDYFFRRGVYVVTNFDLNYSISDREITYQLKDKFNIFSGNTGVLDTGYEIPVGTPIDICITDLLNLPCSDGDHYDLKTCIIDVKYSGFVTQSTIRIDEGGHVSDILDQLATQMSAEYYYSATGNLLFVPIDESMNDIDKPILWSYEDVDLSSLELKYEEDIINVIKVTGTNVDGALCSGVAKNENLASPINIYAIKERRKATIDNANVWTDDMAKELAEYNLRQATLFQLKQSISVPFNPLLMVNNIIELTNENLHMSKQKWLITGISYTMGDRSMNLDLTAINYLPSTVKGV